MIDKKELKRKYKETPPHMGIFQIKNLVNGKVFIDCALNLKGKENSFNFQLNAGLHINSELQKDYNTFGADKFIFEIIDTLEPKDEIDFNYREEIKVLKEMWIEKLKPFGEKGYNKKNN